MARKTAQEARVERWTWYAMVFVFVVVGFDRDLLLPSWIVPGVLGSILFFSALYQYSKIKLGWRAGMLNIITATVLILLAAYDFYIGSPADPVLVSFIATMAIIGYGIVTNEG
ncbi:MAG: hypothetical protein NZ750_00655 [Anaerolineae bacterium]|nr:hypothetical protein [Anaerolineae bacterium]MDW8173094.1 hypothetical protein [Anaerolineae bacterium]